MTEQKRTRKIRTPEEPIVSGCFEASLALTAVQDSHGLHLCLLALLKEIPGFLSAEIYEMRRPDEGALAGEMGGPLFLDNAVEENEPPLDATLDPMVLESLKTHLPVIQLCTQNRCQRYVFPVPGEVGPLRLVVLRAEPLSAEMRKMIGNALAIYRNQIRLLDKKERDPLTGLLNRLSFDDELVRHLERVVNHAEARGRGAGRPWLAFLDIDYFKRINDRFGHLYGDEILILFARLLQRHFRHTDLPFRYGGEEFVVLLSAVSEVEVHAALERFRSAVESYPFPTIGQVTVSIGFAAFTGLELPSTLIDHADQALYHAKNHGRNQVVFYGDLQEAGEEEPEPDEGGIELF